MLKNLFPGLLTLCLVLLIFQRGYSGDPLPNFIIIFTDDMGYGDLSCYGNKLTKTPNIDRIG